MSPKLGAKHNLKLQVRWRIKYLLSQQPQLWYVNCLSHFISKWEKDFRFKMRALTSDFITNLESSKNPYCVGAKQICETTAEKKLLSLRKETTRPKIVAKVREMFTSIVIKWPQNPIHSESCVCHVIKNRNRILNLLVDFNFFNNIYYIKFQLMRANHYRPFHLNISDFAPISEMIFTPLPFNKQIKKEIWTRGSKQYSSKNIMKASFPRFGDVSSKGEVHLDHFTNSFFSSVFP